jgi:hypothetical protein
MSSYNDYIYIPKNRTYRINNKIKPDKCFYVMKDNRICDINIVFEEDYLYVYIDNVVVLLTKTIDKKKAIKYIQISDSSTVLCIPSNTKLLFYNVSDLVNSSKKDKIYSDVPIKYDDYEPLKCVFSGEKMIIIEDNISVYRLTTLSHIEKKIVDIKKISIKTHIDCNDDIVVIYNNDTVIIIDMKLNKTRMKYNCVDDIIGVNILNHYIVAIYTKSKLYIIINDSLIETDNRMTDIVRGYIMNMNEHIKLIYIVDRLLQFECFKLDISTKKMNHIGTIACNSNENITYVQIDKNNVYIEDEFKLDYIDIKTALIIIFLSNYLTFSDRYLKKWTDEKHKIIVNNQNDEKTYEISYDTTQILDTDTVLVKKFENFYTPIIRLNGVERDSVEVFFDLISHPEDLDTYIDAIQNGKYVDEKIKILTNVASSFVQIMKKNNYVLNILLLFSYKLSASTSYIPRCNQFLNRFIEKIAKYIEKNV